MPTSEEQQIQLDRIGNVCVIKFTGISHRANVFTIPLLERLNSVLDEIEEKHLPCSVLFAGNGKFFSAGFDLQSLTGTPHKKTDSNGSKMASKTPSGQDLVNTSWKVLARLLVFPAPTIALFNGHAFGLGLFIGLACDHRVMMINSKCFLCLPEITIGLPLGSGFAALAKCKMNPNALRTSALTGKKWTSSDALKEGIIDAVVPPSPEGDTAMPQAVLKLAEKLVSTSEKGNLSPIKMELYHETYAVLSGAKARL